MEIRMTFDADYDDYIPESQARIGDMLTDVLNDFYNVRLDVGFDYIPMVADMINLDDGGEIKILEAPDYWYLDDDEGKKNTASEVICQIWVVKSRTIYYNEIDIFLQPESRKYKSN